MTSIVQKLISLETAQIIKIIVATGILICSLALAITMGIKGRLHKGILGIMLLLCLSYTTMSLVSYETRAVEEYEPARKDYTVYIEGQEADIDEEKFDFSGYVANYDDANHVVNYQKKECGPYVFIFMWIIMISVPLIRIHWDSRY